MRMVYRVLAFVVAGLVAVQAAAIALAMFGVIHYIEGGGTLDASTAGPDSGTSFPGDVGFMIHAMGGTMVIPIVVLLLLISSFFAKTPGAIKWALIVLVITVVQIALGIGAFSALGLSFLHGVVALVLFGAAIMAGMRAKKPTPPAETAAPGAATPVATV